MGDDPERMDAGAVVVAKPVRRAEAHGGAADAGYLYLVLHTQQLPADRWDVLRSSFARPALGAVLAVVALTTRERKPMPRRPLSAYFLAARIWS